MTVIIHHVSCSMTSGPPDTMHFLEVKAMAERIEQYARRLGFDVLYENADEDD